MSHRIAPPGETPTHFLECSYLRQFADVLEQRNAGEAIAGDVLWALTVEWRQSCRPEILRCTRGEYGGLRLDQMNPKVRRNLVPHSHIVEFVDGLILDIQTLFGWPPPENMKIDSARIDQLRAYIRELNECTERVEIKY